MEDGLLTPDSGPKSAFYDPEYSSDVETLAFCMALPDNHLGLPFEQGALAQMCADSVLKVPVGPRATFKALPSADPPHSTPSLTPLPQSPI